MITTLRLMNVACRTVHLAAFALLLGGHYWAIDVGQLRVTLWVTIASGVALAALEVAADPRWLVEARGLMAGLKLGLVLLVPFAWDHRVAILMAVVVIGSVGSHMPRWFRHASLAGAREPDNGRVRGVTTRI